MSLELNGTTGVQGNSGAFVAGTAVASTSGTSIDFTSIPSWVKRITVMFDQVSTNGSAYIRVQLGTSSGVETTGYNSSSAYLGGAIGAGDSTAGFDSYGDSSATAVRSGLYTFTLLGSNTWVMNASYRYGMSAYGIIIYGSKTLSGTLDRVRITPANGTDAFDAGTINILYE